MINKLVYVFLLFLCMWINSSIPYDFNSTIRTGNLTFLTTSASVLIVLIMRHHHLSSEPVKHFKRLSVVRILLGNNLLSCGNEIFPGNAHPSEQGLYSIIYV